MRFLIIVLVLLSFSNVYAQSPSGWNFGYAGDNFNNDALLDLRYLNEEEAGENGFIKLSPDGESFVKGNGDAIRFWAINGASVIKDLSAIERLTYPKFLAKMGVNIIRFHGGIHPKDPAQPLSEPDPEEVDAIWKAVADMKKEGIYTVVSPFWAGKVQEMYASWGIDGYSGSVKPWGVMYFNDKLKNAYKSWTDHLFTEINPYTGIALKDDPAVALIQIKNEDGVLFWTIDQLKDPVMAEAERQLYTWLVDKYGSIDDAFAAWDDFTTENDDVATQRVDLLIAWEMTQPQSGGKAQRVADQVAFLVDVQRSFYQEMYDHYRSMGCQQLINTTNWKTADPTLLFDAERYTNAVAEVIAVNRYYSPNHSGENNGWRIDPGHYFEGKSALLQPHKLPINIKQVKGHPTLVTESGWNLPHKYQAEGPFLISAYMSLTGVDGYFWFAPNHQNYHDNPYFTFLNFDGGQHAMHRWTVSTPGQIGMFPANALLYRKGYLQTGTPVIQEKRTLTEIYNREVPIISEENSFDPNRDTYDNSDPLATEYSPLSYLAGPVNVEYASDDGNNISGQLSELVDFENKMVESITGELSIDYETGIATMDAPAAQGVCGFLNKVKTFDLSSIKVNSENDYAVVNVVSMDEKTLDESSEVLIQIGTVYRPTGWRESEASFEHRGETIQGFRVDNTGEMPWKGANVMTDVTIKNPKLTKAIMLNSAGYPIGAAPFDYVDGGIKVNLPNDAMYVVVREETITDLPDLGSTKFNIYPNPTESQFFLQWDESLANIKSVNVRSMDGREVIFKIKVNEGINQILLPQLTKGVYVVSITDIESNVYNKRLVIE